MEKFSVLISVYAREDPKRLELSLNSIFNQTLLPDEVVLVEDGPLTNELKQVIEDYPLLKLIKIDKNGGLSNALNVGLKYCSNDIVARMDSDDICFPMRFEKQITYLKSHPEIDIVGSYAIRIDEEGNNLNKLVAVPTIHEDIIRLIWTCPLNHPTVAYRRKKIQFVGGYNPKAGSRQDDYELWFRCVEYGLKLANIPEPLLYYRFFSECVKKNSVKVGWCRMKVGLSGCRKLHLPIKAYIGVCIPFIRSLLPYPLNMYFQLLMNKFNPRIIDSQA